MEAKDVASPRTGAASQLAQGGALCCPLRALVPPGGALGWARCPSQGCEFITSQPVGSAPQQNVVGAADTGDMPTGHAWMLFLHFHL